jgi:hypothetical protein
MKILDQTDTMSELCKATGKWGMFVSFDDDVGDLNELKQAAPWLCDDVGNFLDDAMQLIADGMGFLLFDSQEEMEAIYAATVGDDGPTELNPYDGPVTVYATMCGPDGKFRNENT